MSRIRFSAALLYVGTMGAAACSPRAQSEESLVARARAIHDRIITIDTHDDIPSNFATAEVDPGVRGERQVDLPKMREGGLDVGFFAVYVGQAVVAALVFEREPGVIDA